VRSVEETHPRPGLSVPVVSVLDADGALIDDDQRALVRYVIQLGHGADVIFAAGTTGEWDRVPNAVRQRVVQVCAEEVAKVNSRLAPLSIRGIDDPVRFVARDVADLLDCRERRIPVYLYDNADIAVDPKIPHIRTRQVKALSRLDFVRGIKVSAPRRVLGNYTQAAAGFRDRGDFGIYVGNAMLIFELFRPHSGWLGVIEEHWNRYRLRGGLPIGVVAGPANALPREWARAWQACRAGDAEHMDAAERVLSAFRAATKAGGASRTIACLKRALLLQGVVASDAVAPGTPALGAAEAAQFDAAFERVRGLARELIEPTWVTPRGGAQ
jgi:dihydrodipicolinate synthase/N-acetylneuraminate lyase